MNPDLESAFERLRQAWLARLEREKDDTIMWKTRDKGVVTISQARQAIHEMNELGIELCTMMLDVAADMVSRDKSKFS